jgi:hypothetical protein
LPHLTTERLRGRVGRRCYRSRNARGYCLRHYGVRRPCSKLRSWVRRRTRIQVTGLRTLCSVPADIVRA